MTVGELRDVMDDCDFVISTFDTEDNEICLFTESDETPTIPPVVMNMPVQWAAIDENATGIYPRLLVVV